ncbi:MAG: T9SS C-terminal target domain-containing protein [Bacteroidia bacterium]|nr:MAG: T9SS C-terminal target domain-containing protein [Bacteroidia bacterium]
MIKFLLPLILITFTAYYSLGQGLILLDADGNDITGDTLFVHGDAHANLIKGEVFFHNDSDDDMQVMVRKIEIDILEGTNNAFCWANYCFTPDVYETTDPIILGPGETSSATDFYAEYYPQGQVGISIIDYEFFSRNEGFEEVIVTVVFETEDTTNIPFISDENQPRVSIYPNPASSVVVLSHNLDDVSGHSKLVIYDISGILVERFPIDLRNNSFTFDISNYPDGLYLYRLENDTGQIYSGKLVIRK